jgi:hypothetical protein
MSQAYEGAGLFEWDPAKAKRNQEKHQVTFEEAMSTPSAIRSHSRFLIRGIPIQKND